MSKLWTVRSDWLWNHLRNWR